MGEAFSRRYGCCQVHGGKEEWWICVENAMLTALFE